MAALHVHVKWKHSTMLLDSPHQNLVNWYVASSYSILSFVCRKTRFQCKLRLKFLSSSRARVVVAEPWRQARYLPHHGAPTSHQGLGWPPAEPPRSPQALWSPGSLSTAPCLKHGNQCFTQTTAVLGK